MLQYLCHTFSNFTGIQKGLKQPWWKKLFQLWLYAKEIINASEPAVLTLLLPGCFRTMIDGRDVSASYVEALLDAGCFPILLRRLENGISETGMIDLPCGL